MSSRGQTFYIATIITITLLTGLVHHTPVVATEPSNIVLVYDFGSQTLAVNVSHYVSNTRTHYIENIEIKNNDFSILNRSYSNQSYDWGMYDTFLVSTAVGDNLTTTATCKRGHSLTQWLIVSSTTSTSSTPTETTTTTQPTDGPDSPESTLGVGLAIVGGGILIIVLYFVWLERERLPESVRQLGARIRTRSFHTFN